MKATSVSQKNQHLLNTFFFVIKMDFRRDLLFLNADTEVTSVKKRNWEAISKQVNKRELLAYKPSNIKLLRSAGTL